MKNKCEICGAMESDRMKTNVRLCEACSQEYKFALEMLKTFVDDSASTSAVLVKLIDHYQNELFKLQRKIEKLKH